MDRIQFSCAICPDRDVCQDPCAWLERRLPKRASDYREKPSPLWPDTTLLRRLVPGSNRPFAQLRRVLTRRQRSALELVFVKGLSEREAARRLRIRQNALRRRLARAFRHIARLGGVQSRLL